MNEEMSLTEEVPACSVIGQLLHGNDESCSDLFYVPPATSTSTPDNKLPELTGLGTHYVSDTCSELQWRSYAVCLLSGFSEPRPQSPGVKFRCFVSVYYYYYYYYYYYFFIPQVVKKPGIKN